MCRSTERGAALALVVLAILILTVVGIAVSYASQTEDRISGNVRLARTAFYAAETGLRAGEVALGKAAAAGLDGLVRDPGGASALQLPGGRAAFPLRLNGATFLKMPVASRAGARDLVRFSVYVRNNDEDPGGAGADTDRIVDLVVLGEAFLSAAAGGPETVLSTSLLEEQLVIPGGGGPFVPRPVWWKIIR